MVINPSFEEVDNKFKTKDVYRLKLANGWSAPESSTDLYTKKSKNKAFGIPENNSGYQDCIFGDIYAGFYSSAKGTIYKESIQGSLVDSLKKGKNYLISFYYSLADNSSYHEKTLGIIFLKQKLFSLEDKMNFNESYDLIIEDQNKLKDKENWQFFSELYEAKGGEKYIIIGNFESDNEWKKNNNSTKIGTYAYYYIDNISVVIVKDFIKDTAVSIIPNKEIILTNLYFETASSTIKNESYQELDNLFEQLEKIISPTDTIVISGHTDDVGKEEDNLKLSENRAKAVAEYLIKKGLQKENIKFIGYGSNKPITDNETEQGREQNRRVELFIKKE